MRSYKADGGTIFNYKSDFSGKVEIIDPDNQEKIEINGKDLLAFVAYCYVFIKRIDELEDMDWSELLDREP